MSGLSHTEENYLKCIFSLSEGSEDNITTNAISEKLGTTAASVTDMIKKLSQKEFIHYEKYYGVRLTDTGRKIAVQLIRRHRLWETFLVEKLGFQWDEVHDMAEELEHIQSDLLTDRLDVFLCHPGFDPHGDPIPDKNGHIQYHEDVSLYQLQPGQKGIVVGVVDHTPEFLQYLEKINLILQATVEVLALEEYDQSRLVQINKSKNISLSEKVAQNLLVRKVM